MDFKQLLLYGIGLILIIGLFYWLIFPAQAQATITGLFLFGQNQATNGARFFSTDDQTRTGTRYFEGSDLQPGTIRYYAEDLPADINTLGIGAQGPPGVAGSSGPPGPEGPTGPPGPAATDTNCALYGSCATIEYRADLNADINSWLWPYSLQDLNRLGGTGSGTPAGNNSEIQFNNSGVFGASNKLFWDGALNISDNETSAKIKLIYDENCVPTNETKLFTCGYFGSGSSLDWGFKTIDVLTGAVIDENTHSFGGTDICDGVIYDQNAYLYYNGYVDSSRKMVKKDLTNKSIWEKTYTAGRFNENLIFVDGNLFSTGMITSNKGGIQKTYPDGSEAWEKTNSSTYMMHGITTDGEYIYIVGQTTSGAAARPIYNKYEPIDGNQVWEKTIATGSESLLYSAAFGGDNSLFACGYKYSGADYHSYYIKTNTDGNIIWEKTNDAGTMCQAIRIIDDTYVLWGGFKLNAVGGATDKDWELYLTDLDGVMIADWNFDGSNNEDKLFQLNYNADGNLYAFGFGTNLVSGSSSIDWRIIRFDLNINGAIPTLTKLWDINFDNGTNGTNEVARAGIQINTLGTCGANNETDFSVDSAGLNISSNILIDGNASADCFILSDNNKICSGADLGGAGVNETDFNGLWDARLNPYTKTDMNRLTTLTGNSEISATRTGDNYALDVNQNDMNIINMKGTSGLAGNYLYWGNQKINVSAEDIFINGANEGWDTYYFTSLAGKETTSRNIYIDTAGDDGHNGSSWAQAFATPQHAIDSIAPVIANGVQIRIYMRGTFTTGDAEEPTMSISKFCMGTGSIWIYAEYYLQAQTVTATANDYIEFSATTANDFWNNALINVYDGATATGRGQVRLITDTTTPSAGKTRLYVSPNWTSNPAVGAHFTVGGKTKISQDGGIQWGGIDVVGSNTRVFVYGISVQDYDEGEPYGFRSQRGGYLYCMACFGYNNTNGDSVGDFIATSGGWIGFYYSGSKNNGGGSGVTISDGGKVQVTYSVVDTPTNYGVSIYRGGAWDSYMANFRGGTRSMNVSLNGSASTYYTYGTNGSSYGFRAENGGQILTLGVSELSESADATSFGYIG